MKTKNSWPIPPKESGFLRHLPLFILGTLGLLAFILLLDRFFPYKAAHLDIGKSEAIEIAANL
jgi:hypothetical protein